MMGGLRRSTLFWVVSASSVIACSFLTSFDDLAGAPTSDAADTGTTPADDRGVDVGGEGGGNEASGDAADAGCAVPQDGLMLWLVAGDIDAGAGAPLVRWPDRS